MSKFSFWYVEMNFREEKNTRQATITREHLARAIKRETGINMNRSSKMVDQIISYLIKNIKAQNEVALRMFGSFYIKDKKERMGRNPKTMVETVIPARKVVKFRIASSLKKRINDNIHLIPD